MNPTFATHVEAVPKLFAVLKLFAILKETTLCAHLKYRLPLDEFDTY
jgi:hypothetical protein